jgi:two-component sensor histidine kinase
LRDLVGIHRAVVGPDQLAKHRTSAMTLAGELGKSIVVDLDLGTIEITAEVLAAIDSALLHLIRNAVDHGIESPEKRIAAGKPATGTIRIGARRLDDDQIEVIVADDGRGIDFGRVRARAIERGLVDDAKAETLDRDGWIELLCTPGFSTRDQPTEISGRGVGLDSVRATALELGGGLTARSTDGIGTTWRVVLPLPHAIDDGHVLSVPGLPFPIVIEGSWQATRAPIDALVIDIAYALGIGDARSGSAHAFTRADSPAIAVLGELRGVTRIRRVVASPSNAFAEVVLIDVAEALLIRPEQVLQLG